MASNFRIISYNFGDTLYLRLSGNFNKCSAHKLANTLKENDVGLLNIFIDTNGLKAINSFNRDIFQKNLNDIKKKIKNLIIIGANKHKIVPNLDQGKHSY